jgi:hypothetical protein
VQRTRLLADRRQWRPGGSDRDEAAAAPGRLARDRDGLLGAPGAGHGDEQVHRTDPAGQHVVAHSDHRDGAALPGHRGEDLRADARAAHAGDDHRAGPTVGGGSVKSRPALRGGDDGRADLCARGRHGAQHLAGVGERGRLGIVEDGLVHSPAGHAVGRPSSTSSTGMPSRTG